MVDNAIGHFSYDITGCEDLDSDWLVVKRFDLSGASFFLSLICCLYYTARDNKIKVKAF